MANGEHLAKILEGVEAWNEWRRANAEIVPDLSRADLHRAKLSRAKLSEANLRRASLRGAYLGGPVFREANLRGASLCGAYLGGADLRQANLYLADLSEADLTRAGLSGAHLNWAHLNRANLRGANLTGAHVGETVFGDNDLSVVKGLETVEHDGPSTVGIDTIYRSQGNIPLAFLRGVGVPENFIESIPSLLAPGVIQFFSCFISYSTKDQEFADRLYADLQNKGVRCWFAPHDIRAGKKIHEQIDLAIRTHEKLLLILSPNSMNSEWVKTEIRKARKRERTEKKRVLFPVRLASFEAIRHWELFDADEGKDLAVEIREYYIPDFSDWESHDPYVEGLKNLLRDLKAEQPKAA
ncbi:MAG: toll/interleukin-1 receptor domain-containing protein [Candidatus Sulfotelmatobacter sp.]